ncbi:hypothetical protein [Saccharothrix coeruleofusca]|nr:hypothetical protein [Saccharothrix coeruleofusca]MBP2337546.1 hypothetical protein [Saccharothrix coeruleofusca]
MARRTDAIVEHRELGKLLTAYRDLEARRAEHELRVRWEALTRTRRDLPFGTVV